jgi:2-phospho-L-lactate guanylyltransferase
MNRLYALVPLKNLANAKTRLASALTDTDRQELVMAMARDVVTALAHAHTVERVVLVSDIPDLSERIGLPGLTRHPGASTNANGLNADLTAAAAWASEQGASHVLIAHADLPLLTPALIDQFTATPPSGLRAACCKHGTGTNLLLTPLPLPTPLVYGTGSLARFQTLAAAAGLPFDIRRDPLLAVDIDELADYEALQLLCARGGFSNNATAAMLRGESRPNLDRNPRADQQPDPYYRTSRSKESRSLLF